MPSPLEKARALFSGEHLPLPPLPAAAAAALREVEPNVFSTRALPAAPYNLEIFSREAQRTPRVPDYAVVGFDGHGVNNSAVHYYLVDDALALFIQLPWGGAYGDPDESRKTITTAFAWAETLQAETRRARREGLIPAGWRLLVVASRFARPGWAWVPSPPAPNGVVWQDAAHLRQNVDTALADLFAGRSKLS